MIKRLCCISLCVLAIATFTGCNSKQGNKESTTSTEISTSVDGEETDTDDLKKLEEELATATDLEDDKEPKKDQGSLKGYVKYYANECFGKHAKVKEDGNTYKVTVSYDKDEYLDGSVGLFTHAFYASVFYNMPEKYKDFTVTLNIKCDGKSVGKSTFKSEYAESDALSTATDEDSYAILLRDSGLYRIK